MPDPYVPFHADWKDYPDTTTPITAAFLEYLEAGLVEAISRAIVDAKGDLIVGSAADTVIRKAVGADDTLLTAASGQAGGMTWQKIVNAMVDSAAAIAVSKLAAGSTAQVLRTVSGVPTWAPATVALTAALPGSPADGDMCIYTDSLSAPTYAWLLQYIAAKASNKWQFLGGSPLYAEVTTRETTGSTSYTALTTAGPSVTVPLAGDYEVTVGSEVDILASAVARHSYDIGGTGAVDADAAPMGSFGSGSIPAATSRLRKKAAIAASTALVSKYKTSASTAGFANRWIRAIPIAVGG